MEEIFSNPIVIENLTSIISAGLVSFVITFLVTPWVGKLAMQIGAVDVALSKLNMQNRSTASRMNEGTKPRLGGLAMFIGIFITLLITTPTFEIRPEVFVSSVGIIVALSLITFVGFMDDKFQISGVYQLLTQVAAAMIVIYFGIAIPDNINFLGIAIDLNTFSRVFEIGGLTYEFIFPNHVITLIWIVVIMNFINWVGGVDGLNISITSIISATMLLFALSASNIPLAIIIAIHIGANMGLLPFNYYPSKIIPGTISDYINGFLIAVFALLGDTRWTITILILAIPLMDAIIVIFNRFKNHPETRKNPLKILSISDTSHLHHRLMDAGYSRKTVLFIESAIMSVISMIAIIFGINTDDADSGDKLIVMFVVAITLIIVMFATVFILKERNKKNPRRIKLPTEEKKQAVVKVILDNEPSSEEDEDYERFSY